MLLGNGDGTFESPQVFLGSASTVGSVKELVVGDFDETDVRMVTLSDDFSRSISVISVLLSAP